jgi:hypothetical protein
MWRNRKMGDLCGFERGHRWFTFSLNVLLQNCCIVKCIECDSFEGYVFIRRQHQRRGTAAENQHWQKEIGRWTLRRIVSENHRVLQHKWQQNWIHILESWRPCFHKNCPTWASRIQEPRQALMQLLKPWLLKIIRRCINNDVTTIKHGNQTTGNVWYDQYTFGEYPIRNS